MSSEEEGYVHRPGDEGVDAETRTDDERGTGDVSPGTDGLGSRGWVLVAVLTVCTLVIPGIIYVRPGILSALGVPYIASLLVLPLLPAAALGLTAVWAMAAARERSE